jgi:uncharacterized membrane protein
MEKAVLVSNDATILGILFILLAFIFATESSDKPFWKKFYTFCPPLLLCYFLPSALTSIGIYDPKDSNLYFMASRYLLPAALVLLTISVDLKEIVRLGPKAVTMFLAGTLGVMIGGPMALLVCSWVIPETVQSATESSAIWRGMATIAGSWIGGGANQTAMKEIFQTTDDVFSQMITVDVLVAMAWMAVLLFGAGRTKAINKWLKADASTIDALVKKMEDFHAQNRKYLTTTALMVVGAICFGATAFSHLIADIFAPAIAEFNSANSLTLDQFGLTSKFFWLIVTATTLGLILSFTPARNFEGYGASKLGSVFIYILVATIGMKMDALAIFDNPGLFLLGGIWILFHVGFLLITAFVIKAPFFLVAVGSQANIGGAASAPVVASAFNPVLAPIGALLAVLGYIVGTYGALICGYLMQWVSNSQGLAM